MKESKKLYFELAKQPYLFDLGASIKGHVPHRESLEGVGSVIKHSITAPFQVFLGMLLQHLHCQNVVLNLKASP